MTKIILSAILFILPMLAAAPAPAASFDCGRASSVVERTICTRADLSRADDALAKAYATAIGGLSPKALAAQQAGERSWLQYRDAYCGDPSTRSGERRVDAIARCLADAYAERIETLEASRMAGGLRFYTIDRYAVVPDPDSAETRTKLAAKVLSYPQIDGGDALADSFNAWVERLVAPDKAMFGPPSGKDGDIAGGTEDEKIRYVASAGRFGAISLERTLSWYGHGAAHPNYEISYAHFLRDALRPLRAADLFKGNWQKPLRTMVLAELKENLGGMLMLDDAHSIDRLIVSPGRWAFSTQGLTVQFQPYEVAPYAAGAVSVTIPWFKMQDFMQDNAYEVTGY